MPVSSAGRMQVFELGREETLRGIGVGQASRGKYAGRERLDAQRSREIVDRFRIGRWQQPLRSGHN